MSRITAASRSPISSARLSRRILAGGVALTLGATLAACGSSSKHTTSSPTTAPGGSGGTTGSSASAPTGSPIVYGVVCTCTGPLASDTVTIPRAVSAWAKATNAAGGINGHPVKLVQSDDASNPGTSASEVQTMISSDHAVAILDFSIADTAWSKTVEAAGVPVIGGTSASNPFYTNPDFYSEGQTTDSLFTAAAEAVKKVGVTKFTSFYCAEAVVCQEGEPFFKKAAAAVGVNLVFDASISATAPNYTAQCIAARQAGATGLYVGDTVDVIAKVVANCNAQGWQPPVIIDGENLAPSLTRLPGIKDNSILFVPNLPYFVDSPANTAMNAAYDKYAPGLRTNSEYNETTADAWVSGKLFQAAALAGNVGANGAAPTAAAMTAGLHALHGETLGGLAPPLTFKAGQPNPVDCWYLAVLKGGSYSTPYGTAPVCTSSSS